MGFLDDAKNLADEHDEQVDSGIDKAGDMVDEKTGGQYGDQVDQGQEFLQGQTGDQAADQATDQAADPTTDQAGES